MKARNEFLKDKAERIRLKSLEMTTRAGSGHPTTAMSAAEIFSVLYFDQMVYDPENPNSLEGDDFVLSKGHGAPGLYATMDEAGMLKDQDIMSLREFDSILEGHPVPKLAGVRLATGSLGQGLSGGLGLAMAMKMDSIDRYAYVLIGDGEMAEGNVWEAMLLGSALKLDNVIGIVDINRLGQSGPTIYEWNIEEYQKKAEAFGWHTQTIDGHSIEEIIEAVEAAKKDPRPSMILAQTVKGKGVDFLENADGRHGQAVSEDELVKAREQIKKRLQTVDYKPDNQTSLSPLPSKDEGKIEIDPQYQKGDKEATRTAFGNAVKKLGEQDKQIVVLDGDVKNSTRTKFSFDSFPDRSVECYIAEQNMIGFAAGLQARGKRPYVATFAAFLTRAHDQIRMASYSQADLKVCGTHTGVSIGEDGPSQMGLEDLAMMRSLYGSIVLSPSDAVSAEKLTAAMNTYQGISYLRALRPKTPVIYDLSEEFEIGGSKLLKPSGDNSAMILGTGITVNEALKAREILQEEGISAGVMDIYSLKPIDKEGILEAVQNASFILTIEDHYPEGGMGEAVAAAVGQNIPVYSQAVTKLPHSGSSGELMSEQGIDAEGIAERVRQLIKSENKQGVK
ncbi:MAG: transketolase [Bacteroidales bacterium]|nr:transketolase [Bacteroidales bacterium]